MTRRTLLLVLASRLFFGALLASAGLYSVLCYVPFVYAHFIHPEYSPALTLFARAFPLLFILGVAGIAPDLLKTVRKRQARLLARAFLAVQGVAALVLLFFPLTSLHDSWPSLLVAGWFFVSLLWVGIIDFVESKSSVEWVAADASEGQESTGLEAMLATCGLLTLSFFVTARIRATLAGGSAFGVDSAIALVQTLATHLVVVMIAFTTLVLLCAVAGCFKGRGLIQFLLAGGAAAVALTVALMRILFAAISLTGWIALILSLSLSMAAVVYLLGLTLRSNIGLRPVSGLGLALRALQPGLSRPGAILAITMAVITSVLVGLYLPPMDYNLMLERLATLAIWSVTFAGFYAVFERPRTSARARVLYGIPPLSLVVFLGWAAVAPERTGDALKEYRTLDASYRLADSLLTQSAEGSEEATRFFAFLERNTNIPATTEVRPLDVKLSDAPKGSLKQNPHVFIIVVDSLRRDYLSPYNTSVTFTPSIDAFARESIVMRNAFTRYGATGLSEPSIWIGGLMLHKQYVKPFYPMNSLEKLVEEESYRSLISRDSILDVILKPNPSAKNIDEGVPNKDYRLCRSVSSLRALLDAEHNSESPLFVYTQPQDIHVSIINRENRSVPQGESYKGFDGAYASRLRRLDECFGAFIRDLKTRGLYDDSIVVLTADHGDSLGEGGRYGHAYTLFPEVVRVPLIVHLPPALRKQLRWDENLVAFGTDVTPSLYYLLGRRPVEQHEVLGRPLFTETLEEQQRYIKDYQLLASSYGAVWGVLRENGRYLYIADGVNYTDYFFDLHTDPAGDRNLVDATVRRENRNLIEKGIQSLNGFYKFNPAP